MVTEVNKSKSCYDLGDLSVGLFGVFRMYDTYGIEWDGIDCTKV
jgi:hypothetical protein